MTELVHTGGIGNSGPVAVPPPAFFTTASPSEEKPNKSPNFESLAQQSQHQSYLTDKPGDLVASLSHFFEDELSPAVLSKFSEMGSHAYET